MTGSPRHTFTIMAKRFIPLQTLFLVAFSASVSAQSTFSQDALSRGLKHVTVASDFMGAAVAIFDFNNDGWQDVYLTGGLRPDKLYKNLGNGILSDVTESAGITASITYKTTSVVTADLDNDGDREIIVGTARNHPLFVYRNNGDETFTHITPSTGMSTIKNTMALVAGDYDLDGKLDVYVINYVQVPRPVFNSTFDVVGYNHTCSPNEMYHNLGGLTFTDVAGSIGANDAFPAPTPPGPINSGCGLAGLFTDINGDYYPDLYVANDFGMFTHIGNAYFQNNYPSAGFQDLRATSGLDAQIFGMGIAQGDYDRDGKLDLYVTNLGNNILYRQATPGVFEDKTEFAGVADGKDANDLNIVGWGTAFFDIDNDGYEDLYVANGYVPAAKTYETAQSETNKLFRNLGNGRFENVTASSNVLDNKSHRGMAVGDLDNDGDEDMIVTKLVPTGVPVENYVLYYVNQQNQPHHWIQVSVKGNGTLTSLDAYGSTIKVYYANSRAVKAVAGGSSHSSQNSSVAHFGLATHTAVDSVVVFWPGGSKSKVIGPPVDSHILIEQGIAGFGRIGCMNPAASNYDNLATVNSGCFIPVPGCTNVTAANYNPNANQDDGSCDFVMGLESQAARVAVYPNPVSSQLNITSHDSRNSTFELFDNQGRLLQSSEFSGTLSTPLSVRPGLYYYRITIQGTVMKTGKLVKQ